MIGAAKRYQELLTTLLLAREDAGGTLADELESRYVEDLDRCWWELTNAEQDDIERVLAGEQTVEAPLDLRASDVVVYRGKRSLPRRKAA